MGKVGGTPKYAGERWARGGREVGVRRARGGREEGERRAPFSQHLLEEGAKVAHAHARRAARALATAAKPLVGTAEECAYVLRVADLLLL